MKLKYINKNIIKYIGIEEEESFKGSKIKKYVVLIRVVGGTEDPIVSLNGTIHSSDTVITQEFDTLKEAEDFVDNLLRGE